MEKITFRPEGEEPVDFYVLEQTVINGRSYILVTDEEDGDGEALVLRDDSADDDEDALYTIAHEEAELSLCASIFNELLKERGVNIET